jgi:hypothetical protein
MCKFFSFIQDKSGNIYYSTAEMRRLGHIGDPDSHSVLASYFKLKCDYVNKFEYTNGKFIVDQNNLGEDYLLKKAERWIQTFSKSDGFQKVCLEAVKQNGHALQYVKKQTPELCLEAVKQNGFALQYVKEQTPEICLEAVRQNERALYYVKEQTPEIIKAAKENK